MDRPLTRRALYLSAAIALGATAAPVGCCCIIPIPATVSGVSAQPSLEEVPEKERAQSQGRSETQFEESAQTSSVRSALER
jgi:hypothetical protein